MRRRSSSRPPVGPDTERLVRLGVEPPMWAAARHAVGLLPGATRGQVR